VREDTSPGVSCCCQTRTPSYLVAHAGEGEGDASSLQLLDNVQQGVAGAYVDEVH
jgi:hypothetical protein